MTAVLSVKGEKYRSVADVEAAIRKLAADISLLPEDSDQRAALVEHVGELFAAIPDENASALLELIAGGVVADVETLDEAAGGSEDEARPAQLEPTNDNDPPLCPMCQGHGVLAVEPPQDPTTARCPACDGYGKVYTGSRVDGHTTRDCPTCNGGGFIDKQSEIPLPPPAQRAAAAPAWPNATWNPTTLRWDAPPEAAPWEGATWNSLEGKYE